MIFFFWQSDNKTSKPLGFRLDCPLRVMWPMALLCIAVWRQRGMLGQQCAWSAGHWKRWICWNSSKSDGKQFAFCGFGPRLLAELEHAPMVNDDVFRTPGRIATALTSGYSHTCALIEDASIICWGYNGMGQLGIGSSTDVGTVSGQMGSNLRPVQLGVGVFLCSLACLRMITIEFNIFAWF